MQGQQVQRWQAIIFRTSVVYTTALSAQIARAANGSWSTHERHHMCADIATLYSNPR